MGCSFGHDRNASRTRFFRNGRLWREDANVVETSGYALIMMFSASHSLRAFGAPVLRAIGPLAALFGALSMGACSHAPQQQTASRHGKEYFPESLYGRASPRVVADGEEVPKGGGRYMVGKPYSVAGHTYVPSERKYSAVGLASWYGDAFHGRRTANGEVYDRYSISAAHPTMPLPSYARVTNLRNHHSIIVRVNDRGPYHGGRVMDLSSKAAEALGYRAIGTAKVKVEYVGHASMGGSDDAKLLASLRTDGRPAQLEDAAYSPVLMAEQTPEPRQAVYRSAALETPERSESQEVARAEAPRFVPQEAKAVAPIEPPARPSVADTRAMAALAAEVAAPMSPSAPLPVHPPLPPQRPFDLGTIPGAASMISVARR